MNSIEILMMRRLAVALLAASPLALPAHAAPLGPGCTQPTVTSMTPSSSWVCPIAPGTYAVVADGGDPGLPGNGLTYRWQANNSPAPFGGTFTDLVDGPGLLGLVSGAGTPMLRIEWLAGTTLQTRFVRVVVTSPCGTVTSGIAGITVSDLPAFVDEPPPVQTCGGTDPHVTIDPPAFVRSGVQVSTYVWQIEDPAAPGGGGWRDLTPGLFGVGPLILAGGQFCGTFSTNLGTTLLLEPNCTEIASQRFRVVCTNSCGVGISQPVFGSIPCAADFNCTGTVTVQDIFDFLAAWFGGLSSADYNHSSDLTVQDIFDFLAAYFAGCE